MKTHTEITHGLAEAMGWEWQETEGIKPGTTEWLWYTGDGVWVPFNPILNWSDAFIVVDWLQKEKGIYLEIKQKSWHIKLDEPFIPEIKIGWWLYSQDGNNRLRAQMKSIRSPGPLTPLHIALGALTVIESEQP